MSRTIEAHSRPGSRRARGVRRVLSAVAAAVSLLVAGLVVSAAPAVAAPPPAWFAQPAPNPAGATNAHLSSTACAPAPSGTCMAVGFSRAGTAAPKSLAEMWNGVSWVVQSTPNPAGALATQLNGVACPARLLCLVVGASTVSSGVTAGFAELWNGSTWSIVAVPFLGSMRRSTLAGIWCDSAIDCVAVGSQHNADGRQLPLVYSWDGTAWSKDADPPLPSGAVGAEFSSVSCISGGDLGPVCYAVGDSFTSSGRRSSLLEQNWFDLASADQWRPTPIVDVAAQSSLLDGLSCLGDDVNVACFAVGYAITGTGVSEPISVVVSASPQSYGYGLTGTARVEALPYGATTGRFSGISCATVSDCTAVGAWQFAGTLWRPLATGWDGATWSSQSTPAAVNDTLLFGVTCDAICTGVGYRATLTGGSAPYILTTHGWRNQTDAEPNGDSAALNGVSCADKTHCIAVGAVNGRAYAERWLAGQWTTMAMPAGLGLTTLTHVSCRGSSFCMAVGYAMVVTSALDKYLYEPVALRWDGLAWHLLSVSSPLAADEATFAGVSCASPTFCVAVGSSIRDVAIYRRAADFTFLDVWNGTKWTINTRAQDHGSLAAVSCYSPVFCEAVGTGDAKLHDSPYAYPMAYRWDGVNWSFKAVTGGFPTTQFSGGFEGVSCPFTNNCTAVGEDSGSVLYSDFNGLAWTNDYPAIRGGFASVSCVSILICEAVGGTGAWSGTRGTLSGVTHTTWTAEPMPLGLSSPSYLTDISCPSTSVCDAVAGLGDSTYVARRG